MKVMVLFLMSVTWRARASLIRQPVDKQMVNKALSRSPTNPDLNNRFNSGAVKTFPEGDIAEVFDQIRQLKHTV